MKLLLNFSTCPNDTFMFYALVHGLLHKSFDVDVKLADIEELNLMAISGKPHITKISFGVYPQIVDRYQLLVSGNALGLGVGPLLVGKNPISLDDIQNLSVAIPGEHTTAHLLFNLAFPNVSRKQYVVFSEVESMVTNGSVDAGVIIHESRFTYQQKGLIKIADLGEIWETQTGLPTPLGGIAVRRDLPDELKREINLVLSKSVQFALSNPGATMAYVSLHAQEMSRAVLLKHINLYVNDFSVSLGTQGQKAISRLFDSTALNQLNFDKSSIFVH